MIFVRVEVNMRNRLTIIHSIRNRNMNRIKKMINFCVISDTFVCVRKH